jgi:hypothetical protein
LLLACFVAGLTEDDVAAHCFVAGLTDEDVLCDMCQQTP